MATQTAPKTDIERLYTAHNFARTTMRHHGLSVPRQTVDWVRQQIRSLIETTDVEPFTGGKRIRRFAGCYGRNFP